MGYSNFMSIVEYDNDFNFIPTIKYLISQQPSMISLHIATSKSEILVEDWACSAWHSKNDKTKGLTTNDTDYLGRARFLEVGDEIQALLWLLDSSEHHFSSLCIKLN